MNQKKTEELVILELFRERYTDFPKGILNVSESPDFILSLGPRKKIGLELTRLHEQYPGADPFSFENISACLMQKEGKLNLYRNKRLQEYWLILTVRDPAYVPRYNLFNKLLVWKFETGYDRVFIFNALNGNVYRMQKS
jgi:hypothetical protein